MQVTTPRSITFRPAQIADGELVGRWMMRPEIAQLDNPDYPSPDSMQKFALTWAEVVGRQSTWMLCLTLPRGERILGQVGWIQDANSSAELFITIAEATDRGLGIGRSAMAWLEQQALDRGLNYLKSRVLGHNVDAQEFFEALGYRVDNISEKQIVREGICYPIYNYIKSLRATSSPNQL